MIFKKISRYMALSSGDFARIFKDFEVPSLPQVVNKLLSLLRNPEVSMEEVAAIVELDPGLTAQILKVVNSAFIGLPQPIKSLKQATSVLGLKKIESLAVSFGVLKVVKDPATEGFDLAAFWTDSLLRALFARELARELSLDQEETFLSALLQDVALPVLLTEWFDVYQRAYDLWRRRGGRLSVCEIEALSWHHAQAGAWLAKTWTLSESIVCAIGLHVAQPEQLKELPFEAPVFVLVALSAQVPSVLESEPEIQAFRRFAESFDLSWQTIEKAACKARDIFLETASSFGLKVRAPLNLPQLIAEV